jgi:hypothetical protein
MKGLVLAALSAAFGLSACATGGDPAAVATRECRYFARAEGARLLDVQGVEPVADGFKVKMRVEDGMSRKANAECVYSSANSKASWVQPLPAGFVRS